MKKIQDGYFNIQQSIKTFKGYEYFYKALYVQKGLPLYLLKLI